MAIWQQPEAAPAPEPVVEPKKTLEEKREEEAAQAVLDETAKLEASE
jgi:hypothetical protein